MPHPLYYEEVRYASKTSILGTIPIALSSKTSASRFQPDQKWLLSVLPDAENLPFSDFSINSTLHRQAGFLLTIKIYIPCEPTASELPLGLYHKTHRCSMLILCTIFGTVGWMLVMKKLRRRRERPMYTPRLRGSQPGMPLPLERGV